MKGVVLVTYALTTEERYNGKDKCLFFFLLLESGLCNVEVGIFFLPQ